MKPSIRVWIRTAKPTPFRVVYDTRLPLSQKSRGVDGKTVDYYNTTAGSFPVLPGCECSCDLPV